MIINREGAVFYIRCKAFSREGVRTNRIRVVDGTVSVYDNAAGHYTTCHRLSARTCRKILSLA